MPFFDSRLQDLVDDDICGLIGLPEGLALEFKRQLDIETPEQRREVAKDWSAMANTIGGRLVYGIEEVNQKGSPAATAIRPLTEKAAISRITNFVASTIQPRVRFDIKAVEVGGGFVLVVEVQSSDGIDLHMAEHPSGGRFYRRTATGVVPMSEPEVRSAYLRIGERRASLDQRVQALTAAEVRKRQEANTSLFVVPLWSRPNLIEPTRHEDLYRALCLDVLKDFDLGNWAQSLRLQHDGYRYNGDGPIPEGMTVSRRYLAILKSGVVHRSEAWKDGSPAPLCVPPERLLSDILESLVLAKYMLWVAGYRGGVRLRHNLRIPQWWSIYPHASEWNEPGTFPNEVQEFDLESSREQWGLAIRELLDPYYHASRQRECALIGRDGVIPPKHAGVFPLSFDRYLAIDRSPDT